MSGFDTWDQKEHACDYLVFPDNIGPYLSIDELSLSKGELYTFLINKDMAKNMEAVVKKAFPHAILITDRFHVAKLALDSLQHIRVKLRWAEMDIENNALSAIKAAKKELDTALKDCLDQPKRQIELMEEYNVKVTEYQPIEFENGDYPKQLLARSRYILAKKEVQWTKNQQERADILFTHYPTLQTAYHEVLAFRNIYEETNMDHARIKFEAWIKKVQDNEMKAFYTVANTVNNNLDNILNFFKNRHTNANAESFNSKIKLFREILEELLIPGFSCSDYINCLISLN